MRASVVSIMGLVSAAALVAGPQGGSAKTLGPGSATLALASLVSSYSPLLNANEKRVMALLIEDKVPKHAPQTIVVKANSILCRQGDVDIKAHACSLVFGTKTRTLSGRRAFELFAALGENGVASDGAAGTIFTGLTKLACTVSPRELRQNTGGGVSCRYAPSP